MVRPYTFSRYADHQVAPKEAVNDLQTAIEDIDANGTSFTSYGGAGGVTVQDEGSPLATIATTLNFQGAGVVASGAGATKTISISGGGAGIGPEWIVVAGQGVNATVKARADYVCTGTADQTIMQSALNALPDNNGTISTYTNETQGGGGIVFVGLFNMTGGLVVNRDHVEIAGIFGSTIFNVQAGFPNSTPVLSVNRDAQGRPCHNVRVRDIRVFGNGIGTGVTGYDLMVTRSRIERLSCSSVSGDGILVRGNVPRVPGNANQIYACESYLNTGYGLSLVNFGEDNRVLGFESHENTAGGVLVDSAAQLFSHCFLWENGGPGMLVQNGSSRIDLSQVKFEQNAGGLYVGVSGAATLPTEVHADDCFFGNNGKVANTDDVQIVGGGTSPSNITFSWCRWGNPYNSTKSRYGLNVVNGDRVVVDGGYASNANHVTSWLNSTQSGTLTVRNVRGHNPIGTSSFGAAGASPYTYTATQYDQTVYLSGGTVSSVTKDGVSLPLGVPYELQAGETIVITHTGAPTILRNRH